VAIVYDTERGQFVFSARHWYNRTTSYICQLQLQQGLRVNDDDVASRHVSTEGTEKLSPKYGTPVA